MSDLDDETAELYERSKNDREIIVGSEIRQIIGKLRAANAEIAEKDAEIGRLEAEVDVLNKIERARNAALAESRTVSDAQREQMRQVIQRRWDEQEVFAREMVTELCAILEQPAAEATRE